MNVLSHRYLKVRKMRRVKSDPTRSAEAKRQSIAKRSSVVAVRPFAVHDPWENVRKRS